MIKFENLTKKFGNKIAVDNVSFNVNDGEIFGFLGPNGAGKTTTIKMLVGMLKIDSGNIYLNNIHINEDSYEAKQNLCYVPDNPDIYKNITGRQYINFIADVYGMSKKDREEEFDKLVKIFEMENDIDDIISNYSHGMQQKVCLISAFIHKPKLIVLDEPMVGLDAKSAFNLKELMRERCNQGATIFFSTHVMEVAEKLCDRLAIINRGKLIAFGTIDEIRSNVGGNDLEEVFLELTK